MEFHGYPPLHGQKSWTPWTLVHGVTDKIGNGTDSVRTPCGVSMDKKIEIGRASHPKCIFQKFQNLSMENLWTPHGIPWYSWNSIEKGREL